MAKAASPDVLDGALNIVRNSSTRMVACSAQPATFAEANGSLKLAETTMVPGDFTLSAGVANGRRATVAAKTGVSVTATGSANHVALLDVAGSRLLYITTCPTASLTSGTTVNFGAWDVEIADPA